MENFSAILQTVWRPAQKNSWGGGVASTPPDRSRVKEAGTGFDGISTKLLKLIFPTIIFHLTHVINLCISCNIFPSKLKEAVVTPVFKGGPRALFSSYRPISVLPVI